MIGEIIEGDCKKQDLGKYDLILTDPPWGTTALKLDQDFNIQEYFGMFKQVAKPTTWFFIFCGVETLFEILNTGDWRKKFEYIWVKSRPVPKTHATIRPYNAHEIIWALIPTTLKKVTELYFNKAELRTFGHKPYTTKRHNTPKTEYEHAQRTVSFSNSSYTSINTGTREGTTILHAPNKSLMPPSQRTSHPTQKPLSLLQTIIKAYCPPGGTILDPFAGSGSTLIAAEMEGRKCTAIETNPEYCDIIKKRVAQMLTLEAVQ